MENDKDQGGAAVRGEAVALSDYEMDTVMHEWARTSNSRVKLCRMVEAKVLRKVSACAADAPSEPSEKKAAAWIDQFGNVFPLGAYQPSGKLSYLDADKRGWKPLFLAADAPSEPSELARHFRKIAGSWGSFTFSPVTPDELLLAACALDKQAGYDELAADLKLARATILVMDENKRLWNSHIEKLEALLAISQPTDPYPLLRAAFTTAESGADGYFVKFKFPTLAAMQAAHQQWHTAAIQPTVAAQQGSIADDALGEFIEEYEWRTDDFCHAPTPLERQMLLDFAVNLFDSRAPASPVAPMASDVRDAARYRWLLANPDCVTWGDFYDRTWLGPTATVSDAIDAAMGAAPQQEGSEAGNGN